MASELHSKLINMLHSVDRLTPEASSVLDYLFMSPSEGLNRPIQVVTNYTKEEFSPFVKLAIWAVGAVGSKRHARLLVRILADSNADNNVRLQASSSIAQLATKLVTTDLVRLLRGGDRIGRKLAAYSLGWTFDRRAVEPLIEALTNKKLPSSIRAQAAESLGNLSARQARQVLKECLSEDSPELRFWCIFALSHVGDITDIPAIRMLADDQRIVTGWWSVAKEAQNAIDTLVDQ